MATKQVFTKIESHLHPTPSWLVSDHPVPTGREEVWRFSPMRKLDALLDEKGSGGKFNLNCNLPQPASSQRVSVAELQNFANGLEPVDRVAALAVANSDGGELVSIPAGAVLTEPIVITLTGAAGAGLASHALAIDVGANSQATVVLRFEGSVSIGTFVAAKVGAGAQFNLVSLQDWADDAVHGGQVGLSIGKDAKVKTVSVSLGGEVVRLVENAIYDGTGGELEQFGIYFADAHQHIEHRLFVDHNLPNTHSNVDYRGALQGKGARTVWVGDVLIRPEAEGISTYESNKNLVLTDGCRADSVPNLEIETGEIAGAGHSSTTGRFDDEQLFYLRSRGISEEEARRLVVSGFFVDIIRRIGVPEIESSISAAIEKELEGVTL